MTWELKGRDTETPTAEQFTRLGAAEHALMVYARIM